MISFNSIILFIEDWTQIISCFFKTRLMSETEKNIEILALSSQLSVIHQDILNHKISKPRFTHDRKKIVHFAVTSNPSSAWVAEQIREATPYGIIPKYLLHDNDRIFTSKLLQNFLSNSNIISKRTSFHSLWQNGICERAVGIFRAKLLNHIVPFNKRHLEYLLKEYVHKYYNPARTHQEIGCRTPILSNKPPTTTVLETNLVSKPILGGLYHSYKKIA